MGNLPWGTQVLSFLRAQFDFPAFPDMICPILENILSDGTDVVMMPSFSLMSLVNGVHGGPTFLPSVSGEWILGKGLLLTAMLPQCHGWWHQLWESCAELPPPSSGSVCRLGSVLTVILLEMAIFGRHLQLWSPWRPPSLVKRNDICKDCSFFVFLVVFHFVECTRRICSYSVSQIQFSVGVFSLSW